MQLKKCGMGGKPRASDAISPEEENAMWDSGVLGKQDGDSINFTLWYIFTKHFGLRGRDEHKKLTYGDITLQKDSARNFFLEFRERDTKTRDGKYMDRRSVPPRVFEAPGSNRDPISIYREFVHRRPIDACKDDSPFYLQPIPPSRVNSMIWFYPRPMGKNKLGSFMQRAAKFMSFSGRKTNHSVRKTTVQTLTKAGVPPQQIIKITGHKSVSSLQHYDTVTIDDHRRISGILTKNQTSSTTMPDTNALLQPQQAVISSIRPLTQQQPKAELGPRPMNSFDRPQTVMNNCTFNFTLAPSAKRRRAFVIESDDDSQ